MKAHHTKQGADKIQRDERWKTLRPKVEAFMAHHKMNNRMLADEMGLNPQTVGKWFTMDMPTTPKHYIMDELEALLK